MRSALPSLWWIAFWSVASWPAAVALAHPGIDRGVARYEEADFEGALGELADAEASGELTRDDLLRLLATRALVHFALQRSEALARDLALLASLQPDYDLGDRAPPDLQRTWERVVARGDEPLSVRLRVEATPGGARIEAVTRNDRAGAVARVTVSARGESGSWREGEDGAVFLPLGAGDEIEAFARAIGPGRVVLATAGSRERPRRLTVPGAAAEGAGSGGTSPWVFVGIGASVAVAAAIATVVILFATRPDANTIFTGPTVSPGG